MLAFILSFTLHSFIQRTNVADKCSKQRTNIARKARIILKKDHSKLANQQWMKYF
jgi:hypothetical protein